MRKLLHGAVVGGTDIRAAFAAVGVGKLSDLEQARYPELLKAAGIEWGS